MATIGGNKKPRSRGWGALGGGEIGACSFGEEQAGTISVFRSQTSDTLVKGLPNAAPSFLGSSASVVSAQLASILVTISS
jgi:hypothetical protein